MSYEPAVTTFALSWGDELSAWQRDMLRDWGAADDSGQFVHRRIGASIPRQAGKSMAAVAWSCFLAAAMGMQVLYTAHNYSTTCEMLRRVKEIFGSKAGDEDAPHPELNKLVAEYDGATAQEAFYFKSGGSIHFSTRTKTAKLGFGFDVIIIDGAQELTDEHEQALLPTMTSGRGWNPQLVFIGTPRRPGSPAHEFEDMRTEAYTSPKPDLCWWEWGVSEVGDIFDEGRWAQANPSIVLGTANVVAIRIGCESLKHTEEKRMRFAQEYLGWWLPPQGAVVAIPAKDWERAAVPLAMVPKRGVKAFGVKFDKCGMRVCVSAALRTASGPDYVELVFDEPTSKGIDWLADWLAKAEDTTAEVWIDGKAGAGDLAARLDALECARKYVHRPTADQVASAASGLALSLAEKVPSVVHWDAPGGGQEALDRSVRTSGKRKIGGDGWGFDGEECCAVESASLALMAARTTRRDPSRTGGFA